VRRIIIIGEDRVKRKDNASETNRTTYITVTVWCSRKRRQSMSRALCVCMTR
jgi:hypothetical protein